MKRTREDKKVDFMKLDISIGIPKENRTGENRVAATPDSVKRLIKAGFDIFIEQGAGMLSGFDDSEYQSVGAKLVSGLEAWAKKIVLKITPPSLKEANQLKTGSLLISLLEPFQNEELFQYFCQNKIDSICLELIPRTSRAQSMDVLSSQANIAGYRAVLEASNNYIRFFPMMMTSAGSAKAAKVTILGAGVAGLQAIATARRIGATVEAYDVRPEVKEQILSLGAKFIEIQLDEQGAGSGGYAKELSEEGKKKLQAGLDDKLKKSDIIITTANVPGRKAPTLVTESVVRSMRRGSVIVDMATPSGGNCPLSKPDEIVDVDGVKIIGYTNYPSKIASDASSFFSRNLVSLLSIMVIEKDNKKQFEINLQDDIIDAALLTYQGSYRKKRS